MNRSTTLLLTPLLLAAVVAAAIAQPGPTPGIVVSQASAVEFHASNYGPFGFDVTRVQPGVVFPRGSVTGYIFGAGIWFGAQKNIDGERAKLSVIGYNPYTALSWLRPGEIAPATGDAVDDTVRSTSYDVATGRPIGGASGRASWPLWLRAGERATLMNSGSFERTEVGRVVGATWAAPAFVPGVAEQFVSRFNDTDTLLYEAGPFAGLPLRLQFEQNVYGWASGPLERVVLLRHQIVNHSSDTLFDCVIGVATDVEIGNYRNDRTAFYLNRRDLRSAYAWSEQEGTKKFGMLVISIVEAPVVDTVIGENYKRVDNTQRMAYRTTGRVGTSQNGTLDEDPDTPAGRYEFMSSGQLDPDNMPGDKRSVLSSEEFTMLPGDTAYFTIAYSILPDAEPRGVMPELEAIVTAINDAYYGQVAGIGLEDMESHAGVVAVYPNPTNGDATLRFTLPAGGRTSVRLVDALGRTVLTDERGMLSAGPHELRLAPTSLPSGSYTVVVDWGKGRMIGRMEIVR